MEASTLLKKINQTMVTSRTILIVLFIGFSCLSKTVTAYGQVTETFDPEEDVTHETLILELESKEPAAFAEFTCEIINEYCPSDISVCPDAIKDGIYGAYV